MRGLRGAIAFLTRVPVGARVESSGDVARAVPWFPVVGFVIGGLVGGAYALASVALPRLAAAALALGAGALLTGALHEDGLGDVADAFGGGRDRDDVLRILHDPRHGTYGVLAVSVALLIRAAAVASLGGWGAVAAVAAAHALSRAAAVGLMGAASPAAPEGLGAAYVDALTGGRVVAGVVAGCALAAVALGPWALPAAGLAALAATVMGALSIRKIGGIAGDVLGATQQVAELAVLCLAAGVAASGTSPAWWRG